MSDREIPVIDLFAGPGGLGEGFSAFRTADGNTPFRVKLSIEKDEHAHRTLRLRSFYRQFLPGKPPPTYYAMLRGTLTESELFAKHPREADAACAESVLATLGSRELDPTELHDRVRAAVEKRDPWILIGGPPCQAYSIAGRSRNKGIEGYRLDKDHRHSLYQEYLRIVAEHWPPIFVMENVTGLLSARIRDTSLFDRLCGDLRDPSAALGKRSRFRYRVLSLEARGLFGEADLRDYIVRAERHGIPQCRHRVILLAVRTDLYGVTPHPLPLYSEVSVKQVLKGLPAVRSGLSREQDGKEAWLAVFERVLKRRWVEQTTKLPRGEEIHALVRRVAERIVSPEAGRGGPFVPCEPDVDFREPGWFLDSSIGGVCNHETKAHMEKDLHRYLFAACYARVHGASPRLVSFPVDLRPDHFNVPEALEGGYFDDRFRVQLADKPSTTVTSHIHKDGHYYIHYDPKQCRSLTVREAARLQTFPDNYFFCGPKTKQFHQVGNAVPPLLARGIAAIVFDLFGQAGMIQRRGQTRSRPPQLEHVAHSRE